MSSEVEDSSEYHNIQSVCVCSTASVKIDKNRLETDGLDGRLRFLPIGNAGDE